MKVYGIKNCNTVSKTITWLNENNIEFEFHDYKKSGISESKLKEWADQVGWEALINKRGTTWKKLDAETQISIVSPETAFAVIVQKTSLIKRPILETSKGILLGFEESVYRKELIG
ncbi:ArsC family reductase [Daejeonella oryzae]|uniref:ArsC family reductase n=1 Tax=Daejeonella oryzae TaxID=1122943 RepID=UPI00042588C1|nr:ArsC family reductase [Daejeonella oryzae]